MYYVYCIQNENGKLYYGFTDNLKRRFQEHNENRSHSTRGHQWTLVYYEAYRSEVDARNREEQLKAYGQALAQLKRRIENSFVGKS